MRGASRHSITTFSFCLISAHRRKHCCALFIAAYTVATIFNALFASFLSICHAPFRMGRGGGGGGEGLHFTVHEVHEVYETHQVRY